jgi:glycosyltransferase involved in cell wall biosynthesis
MNILIINSNNPLQTSGIVSYDFFRGLIKMGHNVRLLTNSYQEGYPAGIKSLETALALNWKKKVTRFRNNVQFANNLQTNPDYHFHGLSEKKMFYSTRKLLKMARFKPDVIFILFAKDFINSRNIYELYKKTNARIYWLLYDMAAFTGGCHYAWNCQGYRNSCGRCPGLSSDDPDDLSHRNLEVKKKYFDRTPIQIISASEWQYRQVRLSSLFSSKIIHKILLPVDKEVFKPVPKAEARMKLSIGNDRKVIFFGSVYLSQKRKGMSYLIESLRILSEKLSGSSVKDKILLLIAGREIKEIKDSLPFDHHYLGFVDNTYGIASAYQAADVFLCPSVEDSGPSMINQSIMCGTPVVCFEMGVALDLVISGQTGYVAKLKDSNDLAQGIFNMMTIDENGYDRMIENCRDLALRLCDPDVQIGRVEKLMLG